MGKPHSFQSLPLAQGKPFMRNWFMIPMAILVLFHGVWFPHIVCSIDLHILKLDVNNTTWHLFFHSLLSFNNLFWTFFYTVVYSDLVHYVCHYSRFSSIPWVMDHSTLNALLSLLILCWGNPYSKEHHCAYFWMQSCKSFPQVAIRKCKSWLLLFLCCQLPLKNVYMRIYVF